MNMLKRTAILKCTAAYISNSIRNNNLFELQTIIKRIGTDTSDLLWQSDVLQRVAATEGISVYSD